MTVDTAALAAHLGCTPAYVRLLVSEQVIEPLPRRRSLRARGRPTMLFDIDAVDQALVDAAAAGRVVLDHGVRLVRKS
jgi:hypothetical protein